MKALICPQCSALVVNKVIHNSSHSINGAANAWVEVDLVVDIKEDRVAEYEVLTEERNS